MNYPQDFINKIIQGDCLEVMKSIPDKSIDLVLTDPPYGINKENMEWDKEFSLEWLSEAERISKKMAILCGTWNLLKMPEDIGQMSYKWILAAHITNGMTRGALGFGNWIPCVVYHLKIKERRNTTDETIDWCLRFAMWCEKNKISKNDLNKATGFSDMGGWWMSKLEHRAVAPSKENYRVLKNKFQIPDSFDKLPSSQLVISDYKPVGDCKDFAIGGEKPEHPSPKPLNVMKWLVESLSTKNDTILDPFIGSGTTAVAAKMLKRNFIGIEISEEYCKIAEKRLKVEILL